MSEQKTIEDALMMAFWELVGLGYALALQDRIAEADKVADAMEILLQVRESVQTGSGHADE